MKKQFFVQSRRVDPGNGCNFDRTFEISKTGTWNIIRVREGENGRDQNFTLSDKALKGIRDGLNERFPLPKPAVMVVDFETTSLASPAAKTKKSPKGAQAYKGNGKQAWEEVTVDTKGDGHTYRLRVPGGFIYRTVTTNQFGRPLAQSSVFVPMPETVGYKI